MANIDIRLYVNKQAKEVDIEEDSNRPYRKIKFLVEEHRIGQEFMYRNRCTVFPLFVLFAKSPDLSRSANLMETCTNSDF